MRTRGPALLRGVNYASGAAGIRDETGNNLVLRPILAIDLLMHIYARWSII